MSTPPKLAAPAAVPPVVEAALAPIILKHVEAALAARPAIISPAAPGRAPALLKYKGMFDTEQPALAALGLRLKAAFLEYEDRTGREKAKNLNQPLREWLEKVKSAGVFESVFAQGGSIWARESRSEEIIDALRPASILLRAGPRIESGYGSKLTIGVINEGVHVAWEGEDEESSESDLDTGDLILGAFKAMGTIRIANSLMRKGNLRSAEQLAADVGRAMGLAFDQAGLVGKGSKTPTGIVNTAGITKKAITGTTIEQKVADLKAMVADVMEANIPLEGANPFYFMTSTTMMGLSSLRDAASSGTGGWVFPGLQDLQNPTINGFPVGHTQTLAGKNIIGFGLAQELYFGNASPLEMELGENGNDFNRDRKTLRGVQEGDWQVRRPKAFSVRTGVTY
ncbi:phage major capsid protein [Corallococcus exiguus]|uniref:Phage major capsid protein n=1 Tax=Corallococcus exiguus TaxID=83462 RepID=A0A7X4Y8D4_9BACT|nr:phage major capsid protein [Corallococcus exiguus]NBC40466.1 phage major capsid protein [Corallococcus exiguus]TNV64051.1 phage major capsid protein [Corallococcus exiguus]